MPTRPSLDSDSAGEGGKGSWSPDARRLAEAPQHSLGCTNCRLRLRADLLLVPQIKVFRRLLSPTPFFFFFF